MEGEPGEDLHLQVSRDRHACQPPPRPGYSESRRAISRHHFGSAGLSRTGLRLTWRYPRTKTEKPAISPRLAET